ncbi:MAG TPA: GNAT family N-acetyltransferase [Bacteroidia bacterium]|jgi:GNAT superfamily N-acetyltransferase|nr:GNAT family N-acetyltransferase [Bacteroidia bacterium]
MKKAQSLHNKEFLAELTVEPLTKSNWGKFEELFGEKGACGSCWCMYYRLPKQEFVEGKTDNGNKNKKKELVWEGKPAGILCCYEDKAIGWCALAPRKDFVKLEKSRVHKPIDDKPVWSIPCFFIHKDFRRIGVSVAMLKGLIEYAKKSKIKILEAYPTIPTQEKLPDSFLWIGLYKSFERAGFKIVDRTSKNRPMVRYYVN